MILNVHSKERITPNMLKMTLHGQEIDLSQNWTPAGYVKLKVPNGEGGVVMRTYTARKVDFENKTLEVDFALHEPAGYATQWALDCKIGDELEVMGPGKLKIDSTLGDWYLFSADMSALPAAISVIETLPDNAKGSAIFEVTSEEDIQKLKLPSEIDITWLIHPNPKEKSSQQLEKLKSIAIPSVISPNVFVAGELSTIREIKSWILDHDLLKNGHHYISSYWKIGMKEEEHKMAKRNS